MTEEWKDIEGYEGYYKISNYGNVKSVDRIVKHSEGKTRNSYGRTIKQYLDGGGYPMVQLHKDGNKMAFHTHRLVALNLIPNLYGKAEVNHIDENKVNNDIKNLEWVTRIENENYGTKRDRCKEHTDYKLIAEKNSKCVIQLDKEKNVIHKWESIAEISRNLGYSKGNISTACNGKYIRPLYGFYWEFK